MCLNNWPAFHVDEVVAGEGLSVDDFSSFMRADGAMQTTYKGYPLYTFANDAAPGDVNGEGAGGTWFTIPEPFYSVLLGDTSEGDVGAYLTMADGISLYTFENDTKGEDGQAPVSACNGGCLNNWPIFHTEELVLPSALDASDFGSFMRADGAMQTTFRGWPLYTFASDAAPGDINGQGAGDVWFLRHPFPR